MPPCSTRRSAALPERRVGGDAGIAVGAAALERQHDLRHRHRLALHRGDARQHLLDLLDAALDRLPRAAGRLDGHGVEILVLLEAVVLHETGDLHHLAAEADEQRAADIGMRGIAPLGPLHHVEALAAPARHAAAMAVDEGHDAVDRRIIVEDAGAVEGVGDEARHRGRAVHRGEDADIVPRPDLAVRALVALEGAALGERQHMLRLGGLGELVVAGEIVDAAIVLVDVLARPDRHLGEADDLPEFPDRLALGDRHRRHLVALRHPAHRRHALRHRTGQDRVDRDEEVVIGMEAKDARILGAFGQAGNGQNGRVGVCHWEGGLRGGTFPGNILVYGGARAERQSMLHCGRQSEPPSAISAAFGAAVRREAKPR